MVLLRELRAKGKSGELRGPDRVYVRPRRQGRQPKATVRFETAPGEQVQVDRGSLPYIGDYGRKHRVRVFVMTMGWSRACYVELTAALTHESGDPTAPIWRWQRSLPLPS